ncbi:MAG: DUF4399 domain-containing protein, partial [Gemmatimonadetes bacterium]|nr:DUF4399 domain-containing protein [Gemmatimonadota bacterium]NIY35272.1 DUF4399 domain-containing protein [Gemmatimonadota bacterium]
AEVEAAADAPAASVRITQPADGTLLAGNSVTVVMEVENLEIVPAGNMNPGTGHHHLIVDADIESW